MRALAALLFVMFAAGAASADVFTVTGVEVDATAESAAAARQEAIADGQTRAAARVVARLTLPEDRALLPPMDASTAALLVSGLEVDEESLSSTRYLGLITVTFDPGQVRGYLQGAGASFVESQARPAVVVPLWRAGGRTALWEANPWTAAWSTGSYVDEIAPLITPTGDLGDIRAVSAAQAEAYDMIALRELAARYGADRVLIAAAAPAPGGVRAELARVDLAPGGVITRLGEVSAPSAAALVAASVQAVQLDWKRTAIVRDRTVSELAVTVLFDDLRQWLTLREAIAGASLIADARLDSLADTGAAMTLRHRGRIDQLVTVMSERGVWFAEDARLGWVARLGAARVDAGVSRTTLDEPLPLPPTPGAPSAPPTETP